MCHSQWGRQIQSHTCLWSDPPIQRPWLPRWLSPLPWHGMSSTCCLQGSKARWYIDHVIPDKTLHAAHCQVLDQGMQTAILQCYPQPEKHPTQKCWLIARRSKSWYQLGGCVLCCCLVLGCHWYSLWGPYERCSVVLVATEDLHLHKVAHRLHHMPNTTQTT